ncbi:MAG: glycine zipper domain-containing protein [Rhodospirillales bacterium]|nr:glycine zipper domain-containing protein [Rhodospirillales bacterium]
MLKRVRMISVVALFAVVGCAGLSETEQRTLTGGAAGAAGGAVIGAIAGDAALGALIGGAVGVAGGYVWDQHKKAEEDAYQRGVQDGKATTAQ